MRPRPPRPPGTWSTPARWPRTAGTSTRRPRGRGSPAKAATSSTRLAGGRTARSRRSTRCVVQRRETSRRTFRFANGASGTIAYLTGGNARFPKETMDVTGGGRSRPGSTTSGRAAVWTGRGKCTTKARGGQDKGQRSEMEQFVEAVRTGAPMPISIDSLLATTRATIAVGESLLSGRPERVLAVTGTAKLGWYARRLAQDVTCRDRLACSASRRSGGRGHAARCARQQIAAPRIRRGAAERAPVHRGPAGGRRTAGARACQGRDHRRRGPAAQRRVGDARRRPDRHGATRLVPRPGDGPPVRPGCVRVQPRPAFRGTSGRQHQAGLGGQPAAAPDAASGRLVPDAARTRTRSASPTSLRSWWLENPFLSGVNWTSGIETRHPADQLRLDPASARRLAGSGGALRAQRPRAVARSAGTSSTWPRSRAAGRRRTTTSSPRRQGSSRLAARSRGSRRATRWRRESPRACSSASSRTTPSRRASTASSPRTITVSWPSSVSSPRSRLTSRVRRSATRHWQLLCAMTDGMAALVDERVRPPRQGDSDEGRVVLLDAPEHNRWPALLALGDALFGRLDWWPDAASDAGSVLVRRHCRVRRRAVRAARATRPSRFADAGVTILRTPRRRLPRNMVPLRRRAARVPVHRRARSRRRPFGRSPSRTAWTSSLTRAPTAITANPNGGRTSGRRSRTTPPRSAGAASRSRAGRSCGSGMLGRGKSRRPI